MEVQDQQKFDTVGYDQKPKRVFDDMVLGKEIDFDKSKFADKIQEINENPFIKLPLLESLSVEVLPESRYRKNQQQKPTLGLSSNISRLTQSNKIDVKSQTIFRQDHQRDQAITDSLCNIKGHFMGNLNSSGSCSRRSSYRLKTNISNKLNPEFLKSDSKNR